MDYAHQDLKSGGRYTAEIEGHTAEMTYSGIGQADHH